MSLHHVRSKVALDLRTCFFLIEWLQFWIMAIVKKRAIGSSETGQSLILLLLLCISSDFHFVEDFPFPYRCFNRQWNHHQLICSCDEFFYMNFVDWILTYNIPHHNNNSLENVCWFFFFASLRIVKTGQVWRKIGWLLLHIFDFWNFFLHRRNFLPSLV